MIELKAQPAEAGCDVPFRASSPPLWREWGWWLEWIDLRRSPVYRGVGVPGGDGSAVIVVPGFLGTDNSISELQRWLTRIGYRVATSGIGRNMDCPDVAVGKLIEAADATAEITGRKVRLVGHSLGGTLSRAAAVRRPDLVSQVITLGSPIREIVAHPMILAIARFLQGHTPSPGAQPRPHGDHLHDGTCSCNTLEALSQPFPEEIARTAVYTRSDGVIDWRSAVEPDPAFNIEVRGTHLGLVVNRSVYDALARLLSATKSAQVSSRQGGDALVTSDLNLPESGAKHRN
jgi:pimeloyl-ACP methyl ester carboxylesterase